MAIGQPTPAGCGLDAMIAFVQDSRTSDRRPLHKYCWPTERRSKYSFRQRGAIVRRHRRQLGVLRVQIKYSRRRCGCLVGLGARVNVPAVVNLPIRG
jgi:hypothetical protein